MIELNEPEMAYPDDVLEVITTDDLRLKLIGEVLANDTSRGVLNAVLKGFDTASDISKMLDLPLPLVLHHLERLVDSGLLTVKEIDHSLKGRDMKRYSASKMAFLIIPSDVLEDKKGDHLQIEKIGHADVLQANLILFGGAYCGNWIIALNTSDDTPTI
ncbi:MAG: ArsR family transcriptional regulator [Nitrososphaerales archaeon]